jgi:hypothetical protein
MRVIAGASPDRRRKGGYSTLGMALVLFGLVIAGVMLAPNLVLKINARKRNQETERLARVREGLVTAMQRTQVVPAAAGWSTEAAGALGMDQTEVEQVFPDFASDANIRRILLIDPGLGAGTLPFTQTVAGVSGTATNLLGASSRLLLISNTKRSLTLPVTNGIPTVAAFDAIWNWVYNPSTEAPPSGWPASWNGNGEFLHVERINLASLFHRLTMTRLGYSLNASAISNVVSQVDVYTLRGAMLKVHSSDGVHRLSRVITKDALFDLSAYVTNGLPLLYFAFSEISGSVATNSGALGASANGIYTNGASPGMAGPRPPTFSGYSSNNTAASFDGVNDYVKGTNGLLNNFSAFTVAGWIKPTANNFNNTDLFGQIGVVGMLFDPSAKLTLQHGTQKAFYQYPYGKNEWHHVAGTGDGINLRLYVDGVLIDTGNDPTAAYGTSANAFSVGANVSGAGNYFPGLIDEVVVYDRALTGAEIATLASGVIP